MTEAFHGKERRPGSVRPIGVFRKQDEAGIGEKVIAVPVSRLTRR